MLSKLGAAVAWLFCGVGAGMIFADVAARAGDDCGVFCYNHTAFCDGGESDECTEYLLSQGHYVHALGASGASIQPVGGMNGVVEYTWGVGLCDTGGSTGIQPEICACGGAFTTYPNVSRALCIYVSSSS